MTSERDLFLRYLPPDQQSRNWGWRLLGAGFQQVLKEKSYPPPGHPIAYQFDHNGQRTLEEFQVIFVMEGMGSFASRSCELRKISAGDAILLFPGEWHTYRPHPKTGWKEAWMGFRGQDAERVMRSFFTPKHPVRRPLQPDKVTRLFQEQIHTLQDPVRGNEQILASFIPMILAHLRPGNRTGSTAFAEDTDWISKSKSIFLQNLHQRTSLETLASSFGMSYSKFRSLFKNHTGYSPREYENQIKLNRAKDLLKSGQYNVSKVAEELGFQSVYYFSRTFKKQFGQSPLNWLKQDGSSNI